MLRFLDAGESHGKGLTAIIEGMPSGVEIDRELIASYMRARQSGYGRGGRQKIESDSVEFLSGVRNNVTIGSPITIFIKNKDYENWQSIMGDLSADTEKRVVLNARPGHADFVGSKKYNHDDCRNVLERASARATATRVAVGAVCMCLLRQLGVTSTGYVTCIGGVADERSYAFEEIERGILNSKVRTIDREIESRMIERIDLATAKGDTLGGKVRTLVRGVKPGLGSYTEYDNKLDAHLAFALMSIQAVKAVEIGEGVKFAEKFGSELMDSMRMQGGKVFRDTNRAGGIEGGMSNGEDIELTVTMKPIPTLRNALPTVNIKSMQEAKADFERSDICAVPALSVICECAVNFEICKFILNSLGKSNMVEIERLWKESEYL